MKHSFSLLAMTVLTAVLSLTQSACTGYYAAGPGPAYYGPSPVVAWGGAGFYGGTYYGNRNAYYGGSYYRGGNSGYYNGARGSADWHNGSGSAEGWRGGSWHR